MTDDSVAAEELLRKEIATLLGRQTTLGELKTFGELR